MPDLLEELASCPLFTGVDPGDLVSIAARSTRRPYRRGQVVFTTGDPSDSLAVLLAGRVKVAARSADGGELVLTLLRAGDVFGELGVVDGGVRSADAEMLDDGEVALIPATVVSELLRSSPALAAQMLLGIAATLRRLTDATADLVFLDLPRRLAKLLLDAPRSEGAEIDLGLSQEQLAKMVGGSRQSVNTALRGFERRGWITMTGSRITLVNPELMSRFAGLPA